MAAFWDSTKAIPFAVGQCRVLFEEDPSGAAVSYVLDKTDGSMVILTLGAEAATKLAHAVLAKLEPGYQN